MDIRVARCKAQVGENQFFYETRTVRIAGLSLDNWNVLRFNCASLRKGAPPHEKAGVRQVEKVVVTEAKDSGEPW